MTDDSTPTENADDTPSETALTAEPLQQLADSLRRQLDGALGDGGVTVRRGLINQVTVEIDSGELSGALTALRDHGEFRFEQLIDLAGVDYAAYGDDEWATKQPTISGFSRAVEPAAPGRGQAVVRQIEAENKNRRFAVVYQLLSLTHNRRLRVRCFAPDDELPVVPSVVPIWNCADWYEREAFDLFGIVFEGHPDLRRLLTDYGFVGHPFRKDFPLIGNVEMRYDAERGRVVYQPVSIEPRVLVPRVIRDDHRYSDRIETPADDPAETGSAGKDNA